MRSIIVIVVLFMAISAVIEGAEEGTMDEAMKVECSPLCPHIYRPVCGGLSGDVGETFPNECMLKFRNCVNRTNWIVLRSGKCEQTNAN